MNFESNGIEQYVSLVETLDQGEFLFKIKKQKLDIKNRESPPAKPSIGEAPKLELKTLPSYLRYVFLGRDNTLPVEYGTSRVSGRSFKEVQTSHWLDY